MFASMEICQLPFSSLIPIPHKEIKLPPKLRVSYPQCIRIDSITGNSSYLRKSYLISQSVKYLKME